jgi:hypothetical protein
LKSLATSSKRHGAGRKTSKVRVLPSLLVRDIKTTDGCFERSYAGAGTTTKVVKTTKRA